jgi:hypothetical protein
MIHNKENTHQAETLTEVLVERLRELVQSRRHLQPLVQHTPLALNAHILGPLHEPVEISLRGKRSANAELLRPLLK